MAQLTDEQITKMAKDRIGFKMHAAAYVIINLFLAGIWFATNGLKLPSLSGGGAYYWPIWTHLGWGLGLAFHGFGVYGPGRDMQAREEQRIREQFGKN